MPTPTPNQQRLVDNSVDLLNRFLDRNPSIKAPTNLIVDYDPAPRRAYACGLYTYSNSTIHVYPNRCARSGIYSYPGHLADRTVYGVIQHELGHHLDSYGAYSSSVVRLGEAPVSSYHPNKFEIFAEFARVFLTNPDLLRVLRPKVFSYFAKLFVYAEDRRWQEVLEGAPTRIFESVERKIKCL